MRTLKYLLVVIIMVVLVLDVSAQAQSVVKQLRQGREQEKAGDLDAAIQTYEQITTNIEANQRQVSQAYYRMGMCYLRKEDKDKAKQQFEHLVTEFPRSLSAVANARRELRKIQRRERDTGPREDRPGVIGQRPKINEPISPTGPPTVVRTEPANFADNVPADLKQISVTFDQQMMNRSWSWTQLDRKTFPKMVGRPGYDRERKTCTLRVKLKPGTLYFVGINYNPLERSPGAQGETRLRRGFKSASGKAAKPYALVFATADVMGRSRPIPEEMVAKAKAINSATKPTGGQGIEGIWLGTLKTPTFEIRVVFKITSKPDGTLTATLDSPDQGARNIPADTVTFRNENLHVEVKSIVGVFDGKMKSDGLTIEGQWKQAGQSMPLVLKRSDEVPKLHRPQKPKRPYPYDDEEVVYENKTDGVKLAGTLTLPHLQGRCPAVLLISGSGPQDRDESIMGHKPFLVLADHLTRQRIAVLRVDDRGVGGSTGSCYEATSEDFAEDVLAGIEYLKGRKGINPKQIGLIGHSEGGIIAPMVAVQSPDVAFIVLMAGTALTGEEIVYSQTSLILRALGVSDEVMAEERRLQEQIFAVLKQEEDKAAAEEKIRKLIEQRLAKLSEKEKEAFQVAEAALEPQIKLLFSPWFRFFLTYDPKPTLSKVRCPVLAINGDKDLQVAPKENLQAIEDALRAGGNTQYTVKELPNLNHLFQTAESGSPAEYAKIEETISPVALSLISKWIRQTVKNEHVGSDENGHVGPRVSEDVGPDEDWGHRYFGPDFRNKNALQLKITNVTDDAIEDVIIDRLSRTGSRNRSYVPELTWKRTGTTLNIMLSPMKDVSGLLKKINFGTIVARKGRKVTIQAKSDWPDKDFRFGPDPDYIVRLKIIGATDSATEDAIKEKLEQMLGSGRFYLAWSKMQSTITADVAPVEDVGAFVRKIDFGTVTGIRGRRVEVKVAGTTR